MRSKRWALVLAMLCGAVFTLRASAAPELVVNGGFETGDFTGWSLSGNLGYATVNSLDPHTGTYAAQLGSVGSVNDLSQTQNLATTSGVTYLVQWWLQPDGLTPNEFSATFGSDVLFDQTNMAAEPYTHYQSNVLATSSSTPLTFASRDDGGYFYLDDVSVTAVPEPSLLLGGSAAVLGWTLLRRRRQSAGE